MVLKGKDCDGAKVQKTENRFAQEKSRLLSLLNFGFQHC